MVMKFRSNAIPNPSVGKSYEGEIELTVPDQTMSLREILERFTRNEPLPIGKEVSYHESEDDLEKIQHMDLVDRAEYVEKLKETQRKYDKQEKARKEKERLEIRKKLEAEEAEKLKKKEESKDSSESAK